MLLTIIIVNYNGAAFLSACLDSVLAQREFFNDFKVVVFDNASTDQSIEIIQKYAAQIDIHQHDTNVGFPNAHNILLPQLTTPYLWLLNNDTEFSHEKDIITPILNHFKSDDSIVGISPKLLNTDGSIQTQGSGLNQFRFKTSHIKQVPFLSGASLFIKTAFFKDIGGFDPNLFFYNDDVDFAMQVKRHKKKLIYYPLVQVTHHGGLSTKFQRIETQIGGYIGSLYLCRKYYHPIIYVIYRFLVRILIKVLYYYYT
ncbi:MAG: glycosyltransferase family 2 protein, partial [Candidatus Margulisiibacteriota bacterium]